jgi:aspartyl-tRNA(Asn)/glutamyl-tRNA(Gln) amidotransferase subunit C
MDWQELSTTAELANIELDDAEMKSLGEAVEQMFSYFSKMMEVDVSELEPTTHVLLEQSRVRPDRVADQGDTDALLENAPDLEDRFIVIPNVL